MSDIDAVLLANERFYRAFARADAEGMEEILADGEDAVTVTHPGVLAITGRSQVLETWHMIFDGANHVDITYSDAKAVIHGDVAIVLCNETVAGRRLTASNVFRRTADGWRLVHHHSGPCHVSQPMHCEPSRPSLH